MVLFSTDHCWREDIGQLSIEVFVFLNYNAVIISGPDDALLLI